MGTETRDPDEWTRAISINVMGWTLKSFSFGYAWFDAGGVFQAPMNWQPSIDDTAAFRVVDALLARGFDFDLRFCWTWTAGFCPERSDDPATDGATADDVTRPLAICGAALLAVARALPQSPVDQ